MPVFIPVHIQGDVLRIVIAEVAVGVALAIGLGVEHRVIGLHIQNGAVVLQLQQVAHRRWQGSENTAGGAEVREYSVVENLTISAPGEDKDV